ncbi:hypothetical protein BRADI_4g44101v3 [Brachypodium distachyon]|uniref:Uncharacterized protein n=1 Tax=Brachypodium distachyon TaxID=15368 RepID=A0A2K2CU28_BRADI|nr:hypothetical protein BRADI_4g44101v3 [Brachypodium distachyon]
MVESRWEVGSKESLSCSAGITLAPASAPSSSPQPAAATAPTVESEARQLEAMPRETKRVAVDTRGLSREQRAKEISIKRGRCPSPLTCRRRRADRHMEWVLASTVKRECLIH